MQKNIYIQFKVLEKQKSKKFSKNVFLLFKNSVKEVGICLQLKDIAIRSDK